MWNIPMPWQNWPPQFGPQQNWHQGWHGPSYDGTTTFPYPTPLPYTYPSQAPQQQINQPQQLPLPAPHTFHVQPKSLPNLSQILIIIS
jgi:hypothetical protein